MPKTRSMRASSLPEVSTVQHDSGSSGNEHQLHQDNQRPSTSNHRPSRSRSRSRRSHDSRKRSRSRSVRSPHQSHRSHGTKRQRKHKHHKGSKSRKGKRSKSHHRHRSRSSSSSESTTSSGESYDSHSSSCSDSSDSEPTFRAPIIPFGARVGVTISSKIKRKIRHNEFIDFNDLLPSKFNEQRDEQLILTVNSANEAKFIKKTDKKQLNFNQWSEAFDTFMTIYIKEHPRSSTGKYNNIITDLFSYRKNIYDIYRQGGNWYMYDQHFRSEMVMRQDTWSTLRFDLQMYYNINYSTKQTIPGEQPMRQSPPSSDSTRTCFAYNSPNTFCTRRSCPYKHVCNTCPVLL